MTKLRTMAKARMVMLPSRPHFFQPILSGFEHQLPIPAAFFKYLGGQDCKRASLRGRGGRVWHVKVNGRFLRDGWVEFASDHDLRVGDFVVFAHEGDMVFDVLVFDTSTCAREYPVGNGDAFKDFKVKEEEVEDPDEEPAKVFSPRESSKEKEFINHKNGKERTSGVGDLRKHKQTAAASKGKASCSMLDKKLLLIKVTPGFNKYIMELPMKFSRLHHLSEKCGNVDLHADLIDQQGRSFQVRLGCKKSCGKVYFGSGWKDFFLANGLKIGHTITFELIEKRKKMTFIMRELSRGAKSKKHRAAGLQPEPGAKKNLNPPIVQIGSSPIKPPHFTIALKAWHVQNYLNIPMDFAVKNGLAYRGCKMILKNGMGRSWEVQLSNDTRPASLGCGWTKVVKDNELKLGDVVRFKLLKGGRKPVMKFKVAGTTIRKKRTTAAK